MSSARFAAIATSMLATLIVALGSPAGASAEHDPPTGTDLSPVLGWSTWSSLRLNVSTETDEAEASTLRNSGLETLGYDYFNQDDGWYVCPGHQGPSVDSNGRWVTDEDLFPPGPEDENGIERLAGFVHGLGLRFGIYVTPGISKQAVAENTPVLGSDETAREISSGRPQNNYNCGGMVGLNFKRPGAQAYVDSIVSQFAAWGVDYIKLDGITKSNAPDIAAWSDAIRQSGRPMQLDVTEGRITTALAGTLDEYATQWESSPDIECYECERGESSFPLTDFRNVKLRFATLAKWHPFIGSQVDGYDDFDSVEVGNCEGDGLTIPERESVLSLWALASSPLILGANLKDLCEPDLSLLENTAVLAVDQDGIGASLVLKGTGERVVAKTLKAGDIVVGLFDTGAAARSVSTTASALGLEPCRGGYTLQNLWTGERSTDGGEMLAASVSAGGVAMFEVISNCDAR